jgi:hypothetical protein
MNKKMILTVTDQGNATKKTQIQMGEKQKPEKFTSSQSNFTANFSKNQF